MTLGAFGAAGTTSGFGGVAGFGATWAAGGGSAAGAGTGGNGRLNILNGGEVDTVELLVAFNGASSGIVDVDGTGSLLKVSAGVFQQDGSFDVENGGVVQVTAAVDVARVSISVRDTGIGIAKADQQRVFEEFTQIEGPLQTRARGTGLGLPLVKRLTELLGGSIEIESEPGVGSRFVVVIPRGHPEIRCAGEGHA